jgi:tRNA(fMet)-specific endonuclease VapC
LRYLLDTNACISLINQRPISVRAHFEGEVARASDLYVSSIVVFELWYGISKSLRRDANAQLLAGFLAGPVHQLAFDDEDAQFAGKLRAEMETMGRPVGQYDLLIAGQALRHRMTLVTANAREFGRVKDLAWEDWSKL